MSTRMTRQEQEPLQALADATGDAAVIAETARVSTAPTEIVVGPSDGDARELRVHGYHPSEGHRLVEVVDLERLRSCPAEKRGAVKVATPEALTRYVDRHIDHDTTTVWGDIDAGRITAILNDHGHTIEGDAGWADHRAELQLQRTPEWNAWTKITGSWLAQVELAEFLEEHLLEVVEPDGSTLLEVTQTFHATTGARFKSSQQLHSGEQRLVYEEDVQASAGRAQHVEIPTDLTVRIRPWLGVDPVDVAAKFRFRVRDGQLALGVKLLYLDDHSRTAVEHALDYVADALSLPAIEGTAPSARR